MQFIVFWTSGFSGLSRLPSGGKPKEIRVLVMCFKELVRAWVGISFWGSSSFPGKLEKLSRCEESK